MSRRAAHYSFWVRLIGGLVIAASMGFLGSLLWAQRQLILDWKPDGFTFAMLGLGIPVYAAGGLLLTAAWRHILLWSGEPFVPLQDAVRIYGRSQIAKYVPGNFAQILGRHVIGRQQGWSHTGLALAGFLELASLLFVAACVSLFGLSQTDFVRSRLSSGQLAGLGALALMGSMAALRACPVLIKKRWPAVAERLRRCRLRGLWPAAALHGLFFLLSGSLFILVTSTVFVSPPSPSQWLPILGLLAAAWVAGVVTPGAPSGLGVRESVLTLGLAHVAPAGEALLAAGLFRFITVFGDVLFFVCAGFTSSEEGLPHE